MQIVVTYVVLSLAQNYNLELTIVSSKIPQNSVVSSDKKISVRSIA